jgi:hydrogenase maturation protein HypF
VIAARLHKGVAIAIVRMVECLADLLTGPADARSVALSGGVFQNRILFEQVATRLGEAGFRVLTHRQVPANDGGLSLGQAVIAAARQRGEG